MKKLLFTGGTGFLGKNVMPILTQEYEVTTCGITPDDMLKANLVEYLENHLALRLEAATAFAGMEEEEVAELPKPKRSKKQDVRKKPKDLDWVGIELQSAGAERTESKKTKEEPIKREKAGQIKSEKAKPYLSEQQEKELEELLRDFLS